MSSTPPDASRGESQPDGSSESADPGPGEASTAGAVPAPWPQNEAARLDTLQRYAILDTPPEQAFDDLAAVAAALCDVPVALVSLVDAGRQWFKANVGLPDLRETPRELSFCAHAILAPDRVFEVNDALADRRFSRNPLVVGPPGVRFYAGAPMVAPDGMPLGTVCVFDRLPASCANASARGWPRWLARPWPSSSCGTWWPTSPCRAPPTS